MRTLSRVTKKKGRETFRLPPLVNRSAHASELIEQLQFQGRLIGIGEGISGPFFENSSIGPVLPKLRSAEEHFGELVGCRQCHLAESNVENRFGSCKALGPRRSFV